jgi:deoxycytidylate deaminase
MLGPFAACAPGFFTIESVNGAFRNSFIPDGAGLMPLEPLPINRAPELIFGLVAPIGVDLDVVAEILNVTLHEMHYDAHVVRVTTLMHDVGVTIPMEDSTNQPPPDQSYVSHYRERIAFANAVRAALGDVALAAIAISAIRSFRVEEWQRRERSFGETDPVPNQAYIVRQIKRPEEAALLREVYGRQFVLISAYASQTWRIARIQALETKSRGGLISEIEAHNRANELVLQDDNEYQDSHGQNVRDAFPLGDVFIDATSRVKCETELRRFIHLLFGSNQISPSHAEYGMYLAKSASLRSTDLSRQVGAAIFRNSGEVLTLGCNEVPKAGGGTYWEGDPSDARDFVLGSDPNEARKTQVLVDLIDRLHKGGHLSTTLMQQNDPNAISNFLLTLQGVDSVSDSKVMDLLEFGRIVHAEMSALSDAARKGISLEGATLFCTTFPCHICAKLILAAGIRKVVYLEPYPKSYASELHGDAICIDSDETLTGRVAFSAFLGVSPFRYRDLFERRRRKDTTGLAQRWQAGSPRPVINVLYPEYFAAERHVVRELGEAKAKLISPSVGLMSGPSTRSRQRKAPKQNRRKYRNTNA